MDKLNKCIVIPVNIFNTRRFIWINPLEEYRRDHLLLDSNKLQKKTICQKLKLYLIFTIKEGAVHMNWDFNYANHLEWCLKMDEVSWDLYQINVKDYTYKEDSFVYLPEGIGERFLYLLKTDKDRFRHIALRSDANYVKYSKVHKGFSLVRFKFSLDIYTWGKFSEEMLENGIKHFCMCYANEHFGFKFFNFKLSYYDINIHCLDYNWAPQLYYRVWTSGAWYLK